MRPCVRARGVQTTRAGEAHQSSNFALRGWRAVAESGRTGRSSSEMDIPGFRVKPGVKQGSDIQRGRAGLSLGTASVCTHPTGCPEGTDA